MLIWNLFYRKFRQGLNKERAPLQLPVRRMITKLETVCTSMDPPPPPENDNIL